MFGWEINRREEGYKRDRGWEVDWEKGGDKEEEKWEGWEGGVEKK